MKDNYLELIESLATARGFTDVKAEYFDANTSVGLVASHGDKIHAVRTFLPVDAKEIVDSLADGFDMLNAKKGRTA